MLNKKIAFALISFVTLSASSAMAQDVQAGSQNAVSFTEANNGVAITNTEQFMNQQNLDYGYGGYGHYGGYYGEEPEIQAGEQNSISVTEANNGLAVTNTEQHLNQYLK